MRVFISIYVLKFCFVLERESHADDLIPTQGSIDTHTLMIEKRSRNFGCNKRAAQLPLRHIFFSIFVYVTFLFFFFTRDKVIVDEIIQWRK